MSDIKQTTVTVHVGVDYDQLHDEITQNSSSAALPFIPERPVDVHDEMPLSTRNAIYLMTKDEAELIKQDPRILHVMWGTTEENGLILGRNVFFEDSSRPQKKILGPIATNTEVNWGLAACSKQANPFVSTGGGYQQNWIYQTTRTGKGVDVVIMDTGLDETHPEFLDRTGSFSRVLRADWYSILGLGSAPSNFYTDDGGHGTHCGGIAAGRTCGWAKDANIYALNILGSTTGALTPLQALTALNAWHLAKTNGNPTVVNMSWGYYTSYSYLNITPNPSIGQVATTVNTFVPSVDAEIQTCIANGIVFVASAGNNSHAYAKPGTTDYSKYSYSSVLGSNFYYLQGGTPNQTPGVISVGALSAATSVAPLLGVEPYQYTSADSELKDYYSACGSRTDIFAPGSGIVSSWSSTASFAGDQAVQISGSYYKVRISGTSMSSPQVAGVIALYLEQHRTANQSQAYAWLIANGISGRISDPGGGYTNFGALNSAANLMLYNAYAPYTIMRNWPARGYNTKSVSVNPV